MANQQPALELTKTEQALHAIFGTSSKTCKTFANTRVICRNMGREKSWLQVEEAVLSALKAKHIEGVPKRARTELYSLVELAEAFPKHEQVCPSFLRPALPESINMLMLYVHRLGPTSAAGSTMQSIHIYSGTALRFGNNSQQHLYQCHCQTR